MNEFANKTAAVIGLARAGVPAARFLLERGAKVIGFDSKTRKNLSADVLGLEESGVELQLGEHGFTNIETCDLIVLSPGLKVHFEPLLSVINQAEARGAEVIGELELASRFCPCPIIGVTGTKGKSTTVKLITEMLRACGVDAIAAGNTGTPLISVLPQLSANSWAVVEVSSFQLEKAPTFKPKIAVLLSLLEDHQDYHPTLEQYFETKLKIFANQRTKPNESDFSLFCVDDPRIVDRIYGLDLGIPEAFSGKNRTTEEAEELELVAHWHKDQLFSIWKDGQLPPIISAADTPLYGSHNRANLAGAVAAVGCVVGKDNEGKDLIAKIADAIRNFQTLPHRLEVVAQKDGVTYVNDSQSTIPDAAIAALRAFPSPVSLLLGGRAKIEAESYANLMRAVKEAKAKIFLFGEAAKMLEEVAHRENVDNLCISRENTLADALQLAKMNSSSGETVVLSPACASFDQFSSYEDRGETFRRLVRAL